MCKTLDVHPFEKARLGVAPFRFVGMSEKVYCACQGAPEQPAGTCDYCGMGIRYCCHIQAADGREFIVGTDCVRKTDKESLVNASDFDKKVAELKKQQRRAANEKRHAKERSRIAAALELLNRDGVREALANKPHPCQSLADQGKTYLDYIDFMRRMAGNSGMLKVVKVIEDAA